MVGTMTVLVEFKTGDRVRLLRPIDGFAAGTEGEIVRIFVAPTPRLSGEDRRYGRRDGAG